MNGAEWIAEKINAVEHFTNVNASVISDNVIFVQRADKRDVHVGVVSTKRGDAKPIIDLGEAQKVVTQRPDMGMLVAIPRNARWAGPAMRWLASNGVAFGGVGDLISAVGNDDDISCHENKTRSFVDGGLRRHSKVLGIEWINSKKLAVKLNNDVTVTVALDESYDITMAVAREAAELSGEFDVLLKTNPNGSITSNGAQEVERLGFQTLRWGELFSYLAKKDG